MLHLVKLTPDGRWRVTIETVIPDGAVLTNVECAKSAHELSDVLIAAADVAMKLALAMLTKKPVGQNG